MSRPRRTAFPRGCFYSSRNIDKRYIYDKLYAGASPRQEGSRWRLAETLFVQKGVIIVTDYELLALVLMIIAIVVSLIDKNGR